MLEYVHTPKGNLMNTETLIMFCEAVGAWYFCDSEGYLFYTPADITGAPSTQNGELDWCEVDFYELYDSASEEQYRAVEETHENLLKAHRALGWAPEGRWAGQVV